jgi:hypothetical protein
MPEYFVVYDERKECIFTDDKVLGESIFERRFMYSCGKLRSILRKHSLDSAALEVKLIHEFKKNKYYISFCFHSSSGNLIKFICFKMRYKIKKVRMSDFPIQFGPFLLESLENTTIGLTNSYGIKTILASGNDLEHIVDMGENYDLLRVMYCLEKAGHVIESLF